MVASLWDSVATAKLEHSHNMARSNRGSREDGGCCCDAIEFSVPSYEYKTATDTYYALGMRSFRDDATNVRPTTVYKKLTGNGNFTFNVSRVSISALIGNGNSLSTPDDKHEESHIKGSAIGRAEGSSDEALSFVEATAIYSDTVYHSSEVTAVSPALVLPSLPKTTFVMNTILTGELAYAGEDDDTYHDFTETATTTVVFSAGNAGGHVAAFDSGDPRFDFPLWVDPSASTPNVTLGNGVSLSFDDIGPQSERIGYDDGAEDEYKTNTTNTRINGGEMNVVEVLSDPYDLDQVALDAIAKHDSQSVNYTSTYSTSAVSTFQGSYSHAFGAYTVQAVLRSCKWRFKVPSNHYGSKCWIKYNIVFVPDDSLLAEEILEENEISEWTGPVDPADSESYYFPWIYLPMKPAGEVELRKVSYKYYTSQAWIKF